LARIEHRGALTDALLSATSSTLVMRPLREASAANSSLDVSTPTSAEENRASVGNIGSFETFCGAVHMGAEHILAGWDHLLFLATLLLGIAATRSLLFAMTAFTVAHSITLALAALGLWTPSPRWVEPAIAASIAISAGVSLTSTKALRPWRLTFALGLLHGFGFASALDQLGLRGSRGITVLLGFNLGVEAGQLAVLAVGLPLVGLLSTYEAPGFLSRENALRTLGLTGACVFVNRLFWP
jgi:hypothetical protein